MYLRDECEGKENKCYLYTEKTSTSLTFIWPNASRNTCADAQQTNSIYSVGTFIFILFSTKPSKRKTAK
uniref:Uncharacterized protein n=1 Tax=Meloidogyne enterolobii TaxID=390850 RepID=A0A6V7X8X7_MELEN|nr:unnamed protein product [Meloidogyne enterolobii]